MESNEEQLEETGYTSEHPEPPIPDRELSGMEEAATYVGTAAAGATLGGVIAAGVAGAAAGAVIPIIGPIIGGSVGLAVGWIALKTRIGRSRNP